MKKLSNLFDKEILKQLPKLEIVGIVFERNDDGLLLECELNSKNGISKINLEVDFYQWQLALSNLKDGFLALRLESLVHDMIQKVDWISELNLKKVFGRSAKFAQTPSIHQQLLSA